MAGSLAQNGIDADPETFQDLKGHEGLDGSGKAAAMDPVSALALEIVLAQGKTQGNVLMLGVTGGDDILQIHIGGVAALLDQLQEALEIALPQRRHLLGHPGVLLIEVNGPQDRPVRADLPQCRDGSKEFLLVDLGQDLLAKVGTDLLQLPGNGGILIRQVRMAGLAVDDAQGMAAGREIKIHRLDDGMPTAEAV